jgi:hypothetical protein
MTVDIKRVIASCKACQRTKKSGGHDQREMQTQSPDQYGMFHRWGLDHIVDLPTSNTGFKHALVCIDYYTKWVEVIPVKDLRAETTVNAFLLNVIARYGTPAEIITDNGPAFKGEFRDFCRRRLIHQRFITEDVPRSNGLAERAVQTVKNALRKFAAQKHNALDWDTYGLAAILTGYRMTPHAATQHSPARILFALDPVLDSEKHIHKMGTVDYMDPSPERVTKELMRRVRYIQDLGPIIAQNLRSAHERDCRRFKARRSGLYVPKVYHFAPGDFVFILEQGQKLGGTLGMRAHDEVLRVKEVRDSGVLVLTNQACIRFEKHMSHCVPCDLPNLLGDTYAGLVIPPELLPCQVCHDHRNWELLVLCDSCDTGWHTYCLSPPLESVPDGTWICPDCTRNGITKEVLAEKEARYKESERARPNLELPGPGRVAKARRLAEEWHGVAISHSKGGKDRLGRVSFQGILEPKWFRIDWQNGSSSEHNANILRFVTRLDDSDLPDNFPAKPPPVVIAAATPTPTTTVAVLDFAPWYCATIGDMHLLDWDIAVFDHLFVPDVMERIVAPELPNLEDPASSYGPLYFNLNPQSEVRYTDLHGFESWESRCPGLRRLLSHANADLVFVPSYRDMLPKILPEALTYARRVVATKVQRSWLNSLYRKAPWCRSYEQPGNMLVVEPPLYSCDDTGVWLFFFTSKSRASVLKVDIPLPYTRIEYDADTNQIVRVSA